MGIRSRALWCLAGAAVLTLAVARRLRTVEVTGDSMLPGLRPGDWLIVHVGARPAPGALVVAEHPEHRDVLIVKRVSHRAEDGWWLESDNQRAPGRRDSWDFGAVSDSLVVGRVLSRYRPLPRPHLLPGVDRRHGVGGVGKR